MYKKNIMSKLFFVSLLALSLVSCNTYQTKTNSNLIILTHEKMESGDSVPLTIKTESSFKTGDKLIISNNSQKIAAFEFFNGFESNQISLRLRMMNSSFIEAKVIRNNKVINKNERFVSVSYPAKIPNTATIDARNKFRLIDNSIKLIISNGQSKSHYVSNVEIMTNAGTVKITPTVLVSTNPYFSISSKDGIDPNSVKINVDILLNSDDLRRYSSIVNSFHTKCVILEQDFVKLESLTQRYSSNRLITNNKIASEDSFLLNKRSKETKYYLKDFCKYKRNIAENAELFGRSAASFGTILKRRPNFRV